ncbi:MAG: hypothetical protein JKY15_08480 [Deltaproteobacteria bacterium]|nr:hypothetical protein [Deltaproteobacteria bacterium]
MKNLLFAAVISLASAGASAIPATYFDAVLHSDALQEILNRDSDLRVSGIKQVRIYRCIGCYSFKVSFQEDRKNVGHVMLATRKDLETDSVEVYVERMELYI